MHALQYSNTDILHISLHCLQIYYIYCKNVFFLFYLCMLSLYNCDAPSQISCRSEPGNKPFFFYFFFYFLKFWWFCVLCAGPCLYWFIFFHIVCRVLYCVCFHTLLSMSTALLIHFYLDYMQKLHQYENFLYCKAQCNASRTRCSRYKMSVETEAYTWRERMICIFFKLWWCFNVSL